MQIAFSIATCLTLVGCKPSAAPQHPAGTTEPEKPAPSTTPAEVATESLCPALAQLVEAGLDGQFMSIRGEGAYSEVPGTKNYTSKVGLPGSAYGAPSDCMIEAPSGGPATVSCAMGKPDRSDTVDTFHRLADDLAACVPAGTTREESVSADGTFVKINFFGPDPKAPELSMSILTGGQFPGVFVSLFGAAVD